MMDKTPVLFTIFNRPDISVLAFKSIKEYQPQKLYIAADGPRKSKTGEEETCKDTRKAVLNEIDWPCEVKTLFRSENLGCALAMYSAISWFFEQEEWGVIIEDDVIVGQDFYRLCEVLLSRYLNNEKIMEISAQNHSRREDINNSYVYSQCYHCWGWATWRRAWNKMDMDMKAANRLSLFYLVKRLGWFRGIMMKYYFKTAAKQLGNFNSWATRWFLSILDNDGFVICPGVNLAINTGTGEGTHYTNRDKNPYSHLKIGKFTWPIKYNDNVVADAKQKQYDNKDFFRIRMIGLKKKIKVWNL